MHLVRRTTLGKMGENQCLLCQMGLCLHEVADLLVGRGRGRFRKLCDGFCQLGFEISVDAPRFVAILHEEILYTASQRAIE